LCSRISKANLLISAHAPETELWHLFNNRATDANTATKELKAFMVVILRPFKYLVRDA
jgi:hypothetical protein